MTRRREPLTPTDPAAVEAMIERLASASSREGKPSGVHMIDGQRMIARHFKEHGDEDARSLADVAECMAHCIENEALLFECLKTEASEAAAMLRAVASERDALSKCVAAADRLVPATEDMIARVESAEAEAAALREALHDAIRRPMGVVPASAEPFYSVDEAEAAEARRIALKENPDGL